MPRIQHVTVVVSRPDLIEPTARFYELVGGIRLVRPDMLVADTPGCWLGFGATQVHLIVGEADPGKAHFALDCSGEYEAVLERLEAAGVERRIARKLWGAGRSFVRDPAGNLVELFERPPESVPES